MNCPHCGSRDVRSTYGYFPIEQIEKEVYVCKSCAQTHRVTFAQFIQEKEDELEQLKAMKEDA